MTEKAEERHASWLELFFDLVAVAGVAQLTHLVHGSTSWGGAGLYVVCFLAFWMAWMCFTVIGNVVGDATRAVPVLVAMAGLVFMAASVREVHDGHAPVFAGAYLGVRVLASRVWEGSREERVIAEWPVVHAGVSMLPWIASFWVDGPWRYALWALGLALDLLITFTVSGERLVAKMAERLSRYGQPPSRVAFGRLDPAHFGERLGLFTIIVLGEGVLTVTAAMAEHAEWHARLFWTVSAALMLLGTLWGAALHHGFGGIPYLSPGRWGPKALLPLHCLITGLLAAFAAGLGDAVESVEHGHVGTATRWLLCGCLAAFIAVGAGVGLSAGHRKGWVFAGLAAGLAIPAALGVAGGSLAPPLFLWLLVVAAGAGLAAGSRARRP
ncbi:low temperature requirement protein A [Amycolatopsis minnesotensis]|uniref:Low temperature requirement protein A n=1 Tax=Amycolatopsis minnesotensis TaxID=337894 RepID=A0ABN2SP97_9PSEU